MKEKGNGFCKPLAKLSPIVSVQMCTCTSLMYGTSLMKIHLDEKGVGVR